MGFLQEQFRVRTFSRRMYYDLINAGLLTVLALLLVPSWQSLGAADGGLTVASLLAPAGLPAALGLLLAIRYGTIDLSLWATMGVGGVVAGEVICNGAQPDGSVSGGVMTAAIVLAVLAGMLVGGLNALLVWRCRWGGSVFSGLLMTGIVGGVIIGVCHWLVPSGVVVIPDWAFDSWVSALDSFFMNFQPDAREMDIRLMAPLVTLRMLLVFFSWAAVLLVLLAADIRTAEAPRPFARWWVRSVSLVVAGGLYALSGLGWLLDRGIAPAPTRLIDEFTIPVAVILSGAFLLRGRGRTMLAAICLPVSLLLCSLWEQLVWPLPWWGYSWQVVLLGLMALEAQYGFVMGLDHPERGRWWCWSAAMMSVLGLAAMASSPMLPYDSVRLLRYVGFGVWCLGTLVLAFVVIRELRTPRGAMELEEDEDDEELLEMIAQAQAEAEAD